jgi:uncharacterized protein
MKTKFFYIAPLLVLAVVLSACGPSATVASAPQPRTLSVGGSGTVYLTPDIANIYIGVHTENPDITQAVDQNNAQTMALVNALKNLGVAEADIQTSNFSVYSSIGYDKQTGASTGQTYMVDNSVYITVRDLSKLGSLLSTAVGAGANNINSITFDVADKSAAMQDARQKAVANAASLADELAQTAGVSLGAIQSITYTDNSPVSYAYGMGGGGAAAPNSSVPIQPGKTEVSVNVSVTYALK